MSDASGESSFFVPEKNQQAGSKHLGDSSSKCPFFGRETELSFGYALFAA
jgi:hypothetical protein